jgi:hypothetical protein
MWTDPLPAGLCTEHELGLQQETAVAAAPPNLTVIVESRPAPLSSIVCPPLVGPTAVLSPMIEGTT